MVTAEIGPQKTGRYYTVWELYDLQESAQGFYTVCPVAYCRSAQTALLKACTEGYSVRMALVETTDDIRIVD